MESWTTLYVIAHITLQKYTKKKRPLIEDSDCDTSSDSEKGQAVDKKKTYTKPSKSRKTHESSSSSDSSDSPPHPNDKRKVQHKQ